MKSHLHPYLLWFRPYVLSPGGAPLPPPSPPSILTTTSGIPARWCNWFPAKYKEYNLKTLLNILRLNLVSMMRLSLTTEPCFQHHLYNIHLFTHHRTPPIQSHTILATKARSKNVSSFITPGDPGISARYRVSLHAQAYRIGN
jgi:hypothetical protein